jgi:hypothetical protein
VITDTLGIWHATEYPTTPQRVLQSFNQFKKEELHACHDLQRYNEMLALPASSSCLMAG